LKKVVLFLKKVVSVLDPYEFGFYTFKVLRKIVDSLAKLV